MYKVPFFVPDFDQREEDAVVAVLKSAWIAMGPRVEAFEQRFAQAVGTKYAVAVNSCTAALHLANLLVDAGPGDEIIVPSLTFAATANAVHHAGAHPIFADIHSKTDWTLCPEDVKRKLTPQTKAVVAMHYGGYPADMTALETICEQAGVALIEDACHGLGGGINHKKMGALGVIGCFSFYSNKIITTGEGGMLTTDSEALAIRAKMLRTHGQTKTAADRMKGAMTYDISEVGYNYRLDDVRAAIGLVQLTRLEESIQKRTEIAALYRQCLEQIPSVTFASHGNRGRPAHYILPIYLDSPHRDSVRLAMNDMGIQTSMHYPPVHQFAHYQKQRVSLPKTEWVGDYGLSLPLYPSMTNEDVLEVCEALRAAVKTSG